MESYRDFQKRLDMLIPIDNVPLLDRENPNLFSAHMDRVNDPITAEANFP